MASIPGFIIALGMQFAVDSPRWLCKVCYILFFGCLYNSMFLNKYPGSIQAGKVGEAKEVISSLWGQSEADKVIEEFQSVIKNDRAGLDSDWMELLAEPHSRGDIKVLFSFFIYQFVFELEVHVVVRCLFCFQEKTIKFPCALNTLEFFELLTRTWIECLTRGLCLKHFCLVEPA